MTVDCSADPPLLGRCAAFCESGRQKPQTTKDNGLRYMDLICRWRLRLRARLLQAIKLFQRLCSFLFVAQSQVGAIECEISLGCSWLQFDGPTQLPDRFRIVLLLDQRLSELAVGFEVVRLQLNGAPKLADSWLLV